MPKSKPRVDPETQIRELNARLAASEQQNATLQAKFAKQKRKNLIPAPKGQAGRSCDKGGYNVQVEMGLEGNDERYNRVSRIVKRYIQEYLSVFRPISEQDRGRVDQMIKIIQHDIPFFRKFANGWCIRDIARIWLSNEQTRRRADLEAEAQEHNESDAETETETPPMRSKSGTKSRVHFLLETDEEAETSHRAGPSKSKATTKPRTKPKDEDEDMGDGEEEEEGALKPAKPRSTKKRTNVILSGSESDDDDDDLRKLIGKSDKEKSVCSMHICVR
ncbi:hypothetical protein B0H11DRAFT_2066590 [Mycena galericulata]|nr:hypothetical protein B0H11DRAFT_2066590 [Mycena galericulata]